VAGPAPVSTRKQYLEVLGLYATVRRTHAVAFLNLMVEHAAKSSG
jgi:hypothetical protein